jgi:glutamate synthase (NADPH/NADH) small chain
MSATGSQAANSKHAWSELSHTHPPKRSASERVLDFLEVYGHFDERTAQEQASRCIQCPNPSCVGGCPVCNPIPQWMLLTAEGRFLEAASVLGSVSSMAEICTRLCGSEKLCESACILDAKSEPVAIGAIEQFLGDYALSHGVVSPATAPPNGFKVAIIGSGPGGLACAEILSRRGYAVTIFDEGFVPGGLRVNGLPAFRIDHSMVPRRVDLLRKMGVIFRMETPINDSLPLREIRGSFDAVYLGVDACRSRTLDIPGAHLRGVIQPIPFLLQDSPSLAPEHAMLHVKDCRVLVIGGGDTALDCARTAARLGAREVWCAYRRTETEMPGRRRDYECAVEEGVRFEFQTAVTQLTGDGAESLKSALLVRTVPPPGNPGKTRELSSVPGTEFELSVDRVIPAIGFDPITCPRGGDWTDLACSQSGGVATNDLLMTSVPGVFAGGDIVRGPAHLLLAIRDARNAAEQIQQFLTSRVKSAGV